MSRRNATAPLPRYVLRVKAGPTDRPVYAVQWHHERPDGTTMLTSRKLGPAWLERGPGREWVKRKGRPTGDYLDARTAELRVPDVIAAAEAEFVTQAQEAERPVTFREIAAAFMEHSEQVKGSRPSTLTDYRSMLAEPGTPHKRGGVKRDANGRAKLDASGRPIPKRTSRGLAMKHLGDKPARDVTTKDVNRLLDAIANTGASNRTVNKHRTLLAAIYSHACRPATFGLTVNPASDADRRRQPPPRDVEFYSSEEVEHLARTIADGGHRDRGDDVQRLEDAQDAELVRLAAYSGLRRGELVALRWRDVDFTVRTIHVRAAVSGGKEVDAPKSGKRRTVPLTDDAAGALDRLSRRRNFTGQRDYVAVGVAGDRLDADALGKRVKAGQHAAGLRPLNLHGLRHTFASQAVAGGIGLADVQAAMGHADIETTSRYLHARPASKMADAFTRAQRAGATPALASDRVAS